MFGVSNVILARFDTPGQSAQFRANGAPRDARDESGSNGGFDDMRHVHAYSQVSVCATVFVFGVAAVPTSELKPALAGVGLESTAPEYSVLVPPP